MMTPWRRLRSVRHRMLFVMVAVTGAALLVAGIAMLAFDLQSYQRSWEADLVTQADILGRASAPALAFDDPKVARENLELLKARPLISAAGIYTAKGAVFASYARDGGPAAHLPALPDAEGARVEGGELVVSRRIVENDEILGTVYLRADYKLYERMVSYMGILGVVLLTSLLVAALISSWLAGLVTRPILAISDLARRVVSRRDFSLRANKTTEDEIGSLADGVNDMLGEIGRRAAELEEAGRRLEREIGERRGAEDALRASERRNRTLVDAITSVVWSADGKGCFTDVQASWSAYTGQDRAQYGGIGWREAFQSEDRAALDAAWARAMSLPVAFELELRLWRAASERHRYVSLRAVPLVEAGAAGEAVREWIGTVTDIDDQRNAEDGLRNLNAELEARVTQRTAALEAANKDLEGFSYSVSHDLRAPVRAIVGFSRLLSETHGGQLDAEGVRKLDVIQGEAVRMGTLIDDLLAFSRLGRKAIHPADIDMETMAREIYQRLHAQHAGAQPDFRLGLLPRAHADRGLFEQVWANYLANALKFSSKRDKPVIEVGFISEQDEHVYYVRDNGAGFDPRYTDKLFGVFQRLHTGSEFPGTGVGLALVHRIVTRHGGRVWADSRPNEGATFYFTLPKEQDYGRN